MSPKSHTNELAAQWQVAQILYPLYAALAREFVIDPPPCHDLEAGIQAPPEESIVQARQWFEEMDSQIQVHQLRQFLQTTALSTDRSLQLLLEHHLHKPERSAADRDKVDFLLVQYFSHCAPSKLDDADVDLPYVAQILEPILGTSEVQPLRLSRQLDELIAAAASSQNLKDLLSGGILEQGRKLKTSVGDKYFDPSAMVAFTRFSFMMRRVFFRLMHQDLNAILDGLRELEQRGVNSLDCRAAQFSSEEPTARLRMICQSWKVMFHAEYSSGQPLRMLVDLHAIVDAALEGSGGKTITAAKPAPRAKAAAASFAASSSDAPEFEVSSTPSDWNPDSSA
jgi:hypothetical protein